MRWKALAASVALSLAAPASAGPVDDLAWLAGPWLSEEGESWTEEHWMAPRGGVMLGTNRMGKGAETAFFEFMRIAEGEGGSVSFWASPADKPASGFPLVSSKPGEAVFENLAHDYPTRIVYRRAGEELLATISGPNGADERSWRFRRPLSARKD